MDCLLRAAYFVFCDRFYCGFCVLRFLGIAKRNSLQSFICGCRVLGAALALIAGLPTRSRNSFAEKFVQFLISEGLLYRLENRVNRLADIH